jgi:hypothetical protein
LRRPVGMLTVGLGHRGSHGAMAAVGGRALRAGDARALREDFHHLRTEADLEWLLDQVRGDGVGVPVHFHMGVAIDTPQFPLGILLRQGGKRLQGGSVQCLEDALAGAWEFLQGSLVESASEVGQPRV